MNPWKRVNPNADVVERLIPNWSREQCEIKTCHNRAERLVESDGVVFGEYCAMHSRTMFTDIVARIRAFVEPPSVGAVDPHAGSGKE